jgi:hypothetical protein
MDLNAVVSWVVANWGTIGTVVLSVLGAASVVAKLTPSTSDDAVVDFLLSVVHGLGMSGKRDQAPPAPPAA